MTLAFHTTRLAPSPTGALHLGHARTFLLNWWLARQAGARVLMRMDDLDAGRATEKAVGQAYEDLRWLGMHWEKSEVRSQKSEGAVVQSRRMELYAEALERLWTKGAIYPCVCSRADIAAAVAAGVAAPHEGEAVVRYPGTCAGMRNAEFGIRNVRDVEHEVEARTGKRVCWRLRVRAGEIAFEDAIAGRQAFDVAREVGDFPLTRFEGAWPRPAYQLACVVDDRAMGVDMVVRGDDLLSSTPRQLLVYEALGFSPPQFAHVPLVIGADGKRLAKRHGESRIAEFRERGVSAERVLGWAAWRCGQIGSPREMTAEEMVAGFDVGKLPRERVVLGEEDLAWLDGGTTAKPAG